MKLKDLKDAFVTVGTTISLAAGAMLFFIGWPIYVLAEQALFYDDYDDVFLLCCKDETTRPTTIPAKNPPPHNGKIPPRK